ncbi:MAG: hypothetical protein MUD12_16730 [Spirochaetes bacterium]|jgi:hypothetical protein|nr:hypothetical protein [Spirochaetota bacterium]
MEKQYKKLFKELLNIKNDLNSSKVSELETFHNKLLNQFKKLLPLEVEPDCPIEIKNLINEIKGRIVELKI